MADKLFSALSLCRKAGRLVVGFDAVCEQAAAGEAKLVLLAADAADRTRRNIKAACGAHCPVLDIPLAQADLARITKKPAAVLAVTDEGLAALCRKAAGQPQT